LPVSFCGADVSILTATLEFKWSDASSTRLDLAWSTLELKINASVTLGPATIAFASGLDFTRIAWANAMQEKTSTIAMPIVSFPICMRSTVIVAGHLSIPGLRQHESDDPGNWLGS